MKNFPHKYYYFGGEDSTDVDVDSINNNKQIDIDYLKKLNNQFGLNWNSNFNIHQRTNIWFLSSIKM